MTIDQRRVGHSRRKPTTLLTNLPGLQELHGLRAAPGGDDPLPNDVNDSILASKSWALWAPGLRAAVRESLRIFLEVVYDGVPKLARLSACLKRSRTCGSVTFAKVIDRSAEIAGCALNRPELNVLIAGETTQKECRRRGQWRWTLWGRGLPTRC